MDTSQAPLPADHPRRLNLGCGYDHRDGYLNVDFQEHHSPDLLADVRELPMLADGEYTELLAVDVLEHLPRSDTARCLQEWARVLAPEGRLHLQMPDLRSVARKVLTDDTLEDHELWIHHLWGTQAYTGDFHLAGFTDLTLIAALRDAGFHRIELTIADEWLLLADAHRWAEGPRHPIAIGMGDGFYGPEGPEEMRWRWTQERAELLLFNIADDPVAVDLGMTFNHLAPGKHRVTLAWEGGDQIGDVKVGNGRTEPWAERVTLAPGPHRLIVSSTAPPGDAPGDPRRLVIALGGPTVTVAS